MPGSRDDFPSYRSLSDRVAFIRANGETLHYNGEDYLVLASTPVVRQPGTVPFRNVMLLNPVTNKVIVWTQDWLSDGTGWWNDPVSGELVLTDKFTMSHGHYFHVSEIDSALGAFAQKVTRQAETTASIFRDFVETEPKS